MCWGVHLRGQSCFLSLYSHSPCLLQPGENMTKIKTVFGLKETLILWWIPNPKYLCAEAGEEYLWSISARCGVRWGVRRTLFSGYRSSSEMKVRSPKFWFYWEWEGVLKSWNSRAFDFSVKQKMSIWQEKSIIIQPVWSMRNFCSLSLEFWGMVFGPPQGTPGLCLAVRGDYVVLKIKLWASLM